MRPQKGKGEKHPPKTGGGAREKGRGGVREEEGLSLTRAKLSS